MSELSVKAQELEQQKAAHLLKSADSPLIFQQFIKPSEVRSKIDPNRTLPPVVLIEETGLKVKGNLVSNKKHITLNGEIVGMVTVTEDKRNKVSFINQIVLEDIYKGKGIGLATYVKVIEEVLAAGHSFRTHDWSQSEETKKIWDKLVNLDIAVVKEKFSSDGNNKYNGYLEIIPETKNINS